MRRLVPEKNPKRHKLLQLGSKPVLLLGLGSLTAACEATTSASVDKVFDMQFDVAKTGSKDIVITKFQVPLDTGSHPVKVWLRHGSHKGSVAGYSQWHNITCGQWKKIDSASVFSAVSPLFKMTYLLLK